MDEKEEIFLTSIEGMWPSNLILPSKYILIEIDFKRECDTKGCKKWSDFWESYWMYMRYILAGYILFNYTIL